MDIIQKLLPLLMTASLYGSYLYFTQDRIILWATLAHALSVVILLLFDQQLSLGIVVSMVMLAVVIITFRNIYLIKKVLITLTLIALLSPLFFPMQKSLPVFSLHASLSLLAYTTAISAIFYCLDFLTNERLLRTNPLTSTPLPLLLSENYCFRLIALSFFLLSLSLLSGAWEISQSDIKSFKFTHKNLFALLTWITFLGLLIKHYGFGWRGKNAMICFFVGTLFLFLSYIGSTFVASVILEQT